MLPEGGHCMMSCISVLLMILNYNLVLLHTDSKNAFHEFSSLCGYM